MLWKHGLTRFEWCLLWPFHSILIKCSEWIRFVAMLHLCLWLGGILSCSEVWWGSDGRYDGELWLLTSWLMHKLWLCALMLHIIQIITIERGGSLVVIMWLQLLLAYGFDLTSHHTIWLTSRLERLDAVGRSLNDACATLTISQLYLLRVKLYTILVESLLVLLFRWFIG